MVSQLFTNQFDSRPASIGSIESGAPSSMDSMDSLDDADFSDEPDVLYVEERTEERRRTARQEYPQLVAYYWDGGSPCAHFIRDISPTGFYLFTEERWYPGTQVMILLQRADEAGDGPERSITVNARVVRFGVDGIGFSFVMPDKRSSRGGDNYANGADRKTFYRFLQGLPENEG